MPKNDEPVSDPTTSALAAAIAREAPALARFVAAHAGPALERRALLRDIFAGGCEALAGGDASGLSRQRLFGIARRRCAQHVERQRGRTSEGKDDAIRALLAAVRPTEREALLLRCAAGLGVADVAAVCGVDEPTARLRVSRALSQLCHKEGGEPGPDATALPELLARRRQVEASLADVLDGLAPDETADFLADDDVSRDLVHDAERMAARLRELDAAEQVDVEALEREVRAAYREASVKAPGEIGEPSPAVSGAPGSPALEGVVPGPAAAPSPLAAGASGEAAALPVAPGSAPQGAGDAGAAAGTGAASGAASADAGAAPVRDATTGATPPKAGEAAAPARAAGQSRMARLGVRGRVAVIAGAAALLGAVLWHVKSGGDPSRYAGAAWSGKVADVSVSFGGGAGLERCGPERAACTHIDRGDDVPAGSTLRTDGQTRAVLELQDGTRISIDRGSELMLDGEYPRRARLDHGGIVADVLGLVGSRARIDAPLGFIEAESTKLSLVAEPGRVAVEVVRGSARLVDAAERGVAVHAGEEGRLEPGHPPWVYPTAYLGSALTWSERAFAQVKSDDTAMTGLGELRAKKVGEDRERTGAVLLASHTTKVRIVGNVARTEIEEEFTNATDDVLEGIFRFPLPPDAQIERLALDVDGKLEDGAFVDRERAAAIWRGAIVNAGAKKPVAEEIVWVPGPWRDPALLEWQRGGRFELRIYPIPRRGSRRVVLAYTQVIPPAGDVRRYVYPLPHDPSGSTRVGRFAVDVQVRGHDPRAGVRARGYEMRQDSLSDGAQGLTLEAKGFAPAGDLSVEFTLPDADRELTAWAYQPSPDEVTSERAALSAITLGSPGLAPPVPGGGRPWGLEQAGASYVAIALRPKLPRSEDGVLRTFALVVDSSRSMFGERYRRATDLATRIVSEMDRANQVTVLACDSTCRELPSGLGPAGPDAARAVAQFLRGIAAEGGSDVAGAIRRGSEALRSAPPGAARIVYIGDGTPTIGPVDPAFVRREIEAAVPRAAGTVTAVAIGSDADVGTLATLARAGGGVVVPYTPGQGALEATYAVLGATYGTTLGDPEVELPEGLVEVTPRRLSTIPAGGEAILVARMTRPMVDGTLMLRGKVGGVPFEQRYPLRAEATTAKGNAFVPRLWAAGKIAEMEQQSDVDSRKRAVELSTRFHVASRYTSLLVLESAAMFQAFGLDRNANVALWTGDTDAQSTGSDGELAVSDPDTADGAFEKSKGAPKDEEQGFGGGGIGMLGARASTPASAAPARKSAAMPAMPSMDLAESSPGGIGGPGAGVGSNRGDTAGAFAPPPSAPAAAEEGGARMGGSGGPALGGSGAPDTRRRERLDDEPLMLTRRPQPLRQRMIPMRKVWDRVGRIVTPAALPAAVTADAIAAAERDAAANDPRRDAVKHLYTLYFLSGNVDRAGDIAERWSTKDPLDPDALTARADVAAARGDRDLAIRILGSVVDVRPGDHKAQWRLARLHRWAGRPELGCRHSLAVAQIRTGDAKLIAEAVRCARDLGRADLASDLMASVADAIRRAADALLLLPPADPSTLSGDLRVEASWDGGDDLDLSMLPSDGNRISWLGAPTKALISARDVQSTSREGLALLGSAPGDYVVEITRPAGHTGVVRGSLDVTAAGERRTVPFVLDGPRLRVALVKITTKSRLVPL
jgi:DNA-directed RNA polymerase specialized sigma24 family protein/tetratricopeptide (TPR) repeat protein